MSVSSSWMRPRPVSSEKGRPTASKTTWNYSATNVRNVIRVLRRRTMWCGPTIKYFTKRKVISLSSFDKNNFTFLQMIHYFFGESNSKLKWHFQCFRCIECGKHLKPGDCFALREEGLYCNEHHKICDKFEPSDGGENNNNKDIANHNRDLQSEDGDDKSEEGEYWVVLSREMSVLTVLTVLRGGTRDCFYSSVLSVMVSIVLSLITDPIVDRYHTTFWSLNSVLSVYLKILQSFLRCRQFLS